MMRIFGQEQTQPKQHQIGTHRSRPPSETLAAWAPLMPRFGITRLADVTGLDAIGLPVFVAVRPNSRALATSQGKGLDRDAARASALMESIEGWHGERVDRPMRHESYLGLRRAGLDPVDPQLLARTAGTELHLDAPLLWTEGEELGTGAPVWVPFDAVTSNFVRQEVGGSPLLLSTNGLASGNHLLEAVIHGLYELIERDALALFSLTAAAEQKARQVDLDTVEDEGCRAIFGLLAAAGVAAAAWDITTDVGVPAYTAVIVDQGERARWRVLGRFSGHGCHLDPGIALARALSEAVQSRLTFISGSRDDAFPRDYLDVSDPDTHERLLARMREPPPELRFDAQPRRATASFEADLDLVLSGLRAAGLTRAVAVDLRRPEFGIPVVRMIVPGLEGQPSSSSVPGPRARAARRPS
jgi:YcaO-like protein with predicted kinase domain